MTTTDSLSITNITHIGFSTHTGDWVEDYYGIARSLREQPLDLNETIENRLKEVKDVFLENRHLIAVDDQRMMDKIKGKRKAEGKKPPKWCLTLCSPHIFKPLAEIWKRATEGSVIQVPLVVKREAIDELIKVLYLSGTERRGAHHEYVISKKHGMVYIDTKPSFYKLQEWAFGRDVVDHAVTTAYLEDSFIKMFNTLVIEKDSFRFGVAAEYDYSEAEGEACDLVGIDSRVLDEEPRVLQQWLHSRIGGISTLTKVVYNHRTADTPATVAEVISRPVDQWAPRTPCNYDRLVNALQDVLARTSALHDGSYFAIIEPNGFSELSVTSILDARKRQVDTPQRTPDRYGGSPYHGDGSHSRVGGGSYGDRSRGGSSYGSDSPSRSYGGRSDGGRPSEYYDSRYSGSSDRYRGGSSSDRPSSYDRYDRSSSSSGSEHYSSSRSFGGGSRDYRGGSGGAEGGSHHHHHYQAQQHHGSTAPPHHHHSGGHHHGAGGPPPHHTHHHGSHYHSSSPHHSSAAPAAAGGAGGSGGGPAPLPTEPPFTAFVRNLSFNVTEDDLAKFFSCHCRVASVSLQLDTVQNRPKGFGWIEFQDLDSLKAALTADGEEFQGRNLKVEVARQQQRRSGPGESRADQELRWSRGKALPAQTM